MKAKSNLKKRIMSFVLALCMMATLLPMLPAAEAAGEGKYHIYDFRKGYVSTLNSARLYSGTYSYASMEALNTGVASDPWKIYKGSADDGVTGATITYIANTFINLGLRINLIDLAKAQYTTAEALNTNPLTSFQFNVTEPGAYKPVVNVAGFWRVDCGASLTLAIVKLNADGTVASEVCKTSNVNSRGISSMMPVELSTGFVNLEKGDYALVIGFDSNNGSAVYPGETAGKNFAYIRSLELLTSNEYSAKPAETAKATELKYDFTIMDGVATTQAAVNAIKYADVVAKGSAPWQVYSYLPYDPTATEFWSKDEKGFLYDVNVVAEAKRDKALNLLGHAGKYTSAAVMLHVPAKGNYVVKFNGGNIHNQTVTYSLMKLKADRSVDSTAEYRATEEGKKLEVSTTGTKEYLFNNGDAISLEAGEYVLAVNCIGFVDTFFKSLTLTPEKAPEPDIERYHVYDFRKINQGTGTGNASWQYLSGENMTYAMTATGGASEINPSVYSDPWQTMNLSVSSSRYAYVLDGYQNMGIRVYYPNGTLRTLKVKVQGSGTYMPVLTIAGNTDGDLGWLNTTVSLSKLNADGTTTLIAERVGIDPAVIDGQIKVELADAPIQMKKGEEYVLGINGNTSMNANGAGFSVWIQKLELIDDYEAKLPVNQAGAEPTKLFYDFTALNDEDHFDSQTAVNAITYADTIAAGSAPWKLYDALPGRYSRGIKEIWDGTEKAFYYWQEGYGLMTSEYGDDISNSPWRAGAVMIHVPVDGKYTVKVNAGCYNMNGTEFYFMPLTSYRTPDCGGVKHTSTNNEQVKYKYNSSVKDAYFTYNNGEAIDLDAGEYILWVGRSNGAYVNSITLTPEGWDEEVSSTEIFGDTYAYVKDGTVYFIGGLKTIEGYDKVGFDVWVNDVKTDDIVTDKVYESFAVNAQGVEKSAADFDAEYIFITEKSDLAAGDVITIKPFIAVEDEDELIKTYHANDVVFELKI